MNKNNNFERTLPEDYVLVKHVDAKGNRKLIVIYTVLSAVPLIVIFPVLCLIAAYCDNYILTDRWHEDYGIIVLAAACAILIVYIILHELTHGITYKIFTGAKLTFGLTLTVAFCGVPDIYVRKKASFAALIMPFIVFTIIFTGMTAGLWFVSPLYGIFSGAVLAIHLGGCVGDLHWVFMYVTRFKNCNTLMRDNGPEQWLYIPESEAKKCGIDCIATDINQYKPY